MAACLNCSSPLDGPFCAQCGQPVRDRLTTRALVGDLLAHLFSFESKVARTVRGLALRPGAVCRAYVAGKRARYVNPLRYCLATLALYLLVSLLLGVDATQAVGQVNVTGPSSEATELARTRIARHIDLVLFLALPLFAFFVSRYYRKVGYHYAEVAAFVLFVVGQSFLYATFLLPVALWNLQAMVLVRVSVQLVLFTWSAFVFFGGRGAWGVAKAAGVQVLYILSILPVALIGVLLTLASVSS